jgi:hypothetical protein
VIASARPCAAIVLDPLEAPLVPFASARQCATIVNSKNKVLQHIVLDAGVAMEPLVATGVEACVDGFGTCEDGFDSGGRSRSGGGVGGRSAITAPKSRDDSEETSCDDS